MLNLPEVNSPLFREVKYGEIVTIDPAKAQADYLEAVAEFWDYRKACDRDGVPKQNRKTKEEISIYLSARCKDKSQAIDRAWCLMQPWCKVPPADVRLLPFGDPLYTLGDTRYSQTVIEVPIERLQAHGVPYLITPHYTDLANWNQFSKGHEILPCDVPTPITLDPKTYGPKHNPNFDKAYNLCLSHVSVLDERLLCIREGYVQFVLTIAMEQFMTHSKHFLQWRKSHWSHWKGQFENQSDGSPAEQG